MKVNAGLRLLPKPKVKKLKHEHKYGDNHFLFSGSTLTLLRR